MICDLNEQQKNAAIAQQMKAGAEERLKKLREKNDNKMDAEDTAELRGRIAEIKALIADLSEKRVITPKPKRNPYQ